jgi:hypothetical protein
MTDEKPTHPHSRITGCVNERLQWIAADNSPTGLPVDVSESGMRRLAYAAMRVLKGSELSAARLQIELAWERAVATGEIGDPTA